MAWSGVTKYIRTSCHIKYKPVEFPNLGIFLPVKYLSDPVTTKTSMKLTQKALGFHNDKDFDIKLLIF